MQLLLDLKNSDAKIVANKNIILRPGKWAKYSSGIKVPFETRNENTATITTSWQFIALIQSFF